jgi:hypothetical protein
VLLGHVRGDQGGACAGRGVRSEGRAQGGACAVRGVRSEGRAQVRGVRGEGRAWAVRGVGECIARDQGCHAERQMEGRRYAER